MLVSRPLALALAATVAVAGAGCSSGGGSGGGGSSSATTTTSTGGGTSAATGSTTGPSTGFTGTDTTPPAFTLTTPGRGGFASGAALQDIVGTATDTQSGVKNVEVNGQLALINGADWTIPATLGLGTNTFTIKVTDHAGNSVHSSWSAIYSPSFLAANQMVPNSAAVRLSQDAINQLVPIAVQTIAAGPLLQNALASAGGFAGGLISVSNVSFGTPNVTATLVNGGVRAVIVIPNLDVDLTLSGAPMSLSSPSTQIDATLLISATNGVFAVSMPSQPAVSFGPGFNSTLGAAFQGVFESAMETALQAALPPALQSALNGSIAPRGFTYAGVTATVEARPNTVAIDAQNLRASGDANVSVASAGATLHVAPGSISRSGATAAAPSFATPHDVSLAIREEFVNRVLFAAWQSGKGRILIDQAFVNQALAALPITIPFPIQLDISFLVPFFPALQQLNPSGGPMPIAFELDTVLPPVVTVQGAPTLLSAALGELQLKVLVDTGAGYQDLLVLALHAKVGASAQITGGAGNLALKLTIGQPVQLNAALLQNPFGLNPPDVDRFINMALPFVVQLAGGMIPPIPLPAIPGGLQPSNIDIYQDGPGGDFLTIEGDL